MKITEAIEILKATHKEIGDMLGHDPELGDVRGILLDMGRTPDGDVANTHALELEEMLTRVKLELR